MFDSLTGGILPIVLIALIVGAASGTHRRLPIAILLAIAGAFAMSLVWFYLPSVLWPAEHNDLQGGWDLVAVAFWSLFAVPCALAALTTVRILRRRLRTG